MLIVIFILLAAGLLFLDLFAHRQDRTIPLGHAVSWSVLYVVAALGFAGVVYVHRGPGDASLFLTAYTLEKVLSVDNLMVFSAVFAYFGVHPKFQHRVLYWGILGAVVMRLIFVLAGTSLLAWLGRPIELLFAVLVGWSAVAVMKGAEGGDEVDHESRWYIRWTRRVIPVVTLAPPRAFFCRAINPHWNGWNERFEAGRPYWAVTPLFLCLVAIEMTDVMFAFDSVPVVIAVAQDPVIVYSAMIFAILGLRSLYFVLEALRRFLKHLDKAVGVILILIAGKLAASAIWDFHVDPVHSLWVTLGLLGTGVVASLLDRTRPEQPRVES